MVVAFVTTKRVVRDDVTVQVVGGSMAVPTVKRVGEEDEGSVEH